MSNEKIVDTSQLQFQELLAFAAKLGFEFNGKSFERESRNKLFLAVTTISFNKMVRLYNKPGLTFVGKYGFVSSGTADVTPFYKVDLLDAIETRQLKRVKLLRKANGIIVVLCHEVAFVNPEAGQEFQHFVDSIDHLVAS